MTDFEMAFLAFIFLMSTTNSIHLIIKAREASIEKDLKALLAKVLSDGEAEMKELQEKVKKLEGIIQIPVIATSTSNPSSSS